MHNDNYAKKLYFYSLTMILYHYQLKMNILSVVWLVCDTFALRLIKQIIKISKLLSLLFKWLSKFIAYRHYHYQKNSQHLLQIQSCKLALYQFTCWVSFNICHCSICLTFEIHCDIHDELKSNMWQDNVCDIKVVKKEVKCIKEWQVFGENQDISFKFAICFEGIVALRRCLYQTKRNWSNCARFTLEISNIHKNKFRKTIDWLIGGNCINVLKNC